MQLLVPSQVCIGVGIGDALEELDGSEGLRGENFEASKTLNLKYPCYLDNNYDKHLALWRGEGSKVGAFGVLFEDDEEFASILLCLIP